MTEPLDRLTVADVARFPRPGTVVPGRIAFTPDSAAITYLFSEAGSLVRSLWRFEIATGERRVIAGPPSEQAFSRDEELRRERLRLRESGVTDYAWAGPAGSETLLVPLGGAVCVATPGGELRELPGTTGAIDPRLSPDGTRVAFVLEGDLHVVEIATGVRTRLTHDARDGLTNGLAEFIAQEELDRDRGFWWSPDGTRIAFLRADTRHIPVYPIVHQGRDTVEVEPHRYPFAGAANAKLWLGIADLRDGAITWMDLGDDPDQYVARVDWRPDGVLTAQVLSRAQQDLAFVAFDGATPRVLVHEHSEPWLNLHSDLRFLEGGEFLWSSERTGFRHLSLHAADGTLLRTLTGGPWVVTRVVAVDQSRRLVYALGTRDGVTERHLYAVPLDGGEIRRVTDAAGWHDAVISPDHRWLVDTHMSLDRAPTVALVDLTTGATTPFFENGNLTAADLGLQPPSIVTLPAADGETELYGALYAPAQLEPGRRYPLVVSVYGGPHAQRVANDWLTTVDMRAQYLAQQGFAVFKLDNRGSANRGLAFEAPLALDMGAVEVADQAAGVRWLAEHVDFVDAGRVGIYGWSYGGYMTLLCLAKEPDVFHVGVAGAPVTHWDGYDTAYTERYMSTPERNPEGYARSAVMAHVEGLRGELLVVHGMVDENVHFRHTARLLVALAAAGKPYEILIYPEERHMPRDAKGLEDQERRVLGFLQRHLAPGNC